MRLAPLEGATRALATHVAGGEARPKGHMTWARGLRQAVRGETGAPAKRVAACATGGGA